MESGICYGKLEVTLTGRNSGIYPYMRRDRQGLHKKYERGFCFTHVDIDSNNINLLSNDVVSYIIDTLINYLNIIYNIYEFV